MFIVNKVAVLSLQPPSLNLKENRFLFLLFQTCMSLSLIENRQTCIGGGTSVNKSIYLGTFISIHLSI